MCAYLHVRLFTCATSRAIHLEIVEDLSTGTFLLAFRRFVGRRSLPHLMISDNASTFEAAASELKDLFILQKPLQPSIDKAQLGNLYQKRLHGLVASGSV